jgi:excisionase family DNA binding protein
MQPERTAPDPGRVAAAPSRTPLPVFMKVDEVAELLRIDAVTIYRAIRQQEFPAVKIRGRYVVPGRAIEMLIDDVIATGRCADIAVWTAAWRETVGAPVEVPTWAR